ncbi:MULTISPECIES: SAM-dependent methyltransferase [Streptomyces]|uniref:SAM-dependent methyltransferase n=1 Tax=Streptomyces griseiscabiei TaxID=2993540 RepID=A0ABU4LK45_9ACTN|nr:MULTISPECIES: SAM-dependent methyltransferase [Streptomyces]MBZ3908160.1 SAM-dependent methyltransferase [Streptomyces griseiscabiei]MDX2915323.1 SAM-dependent methyltransferase [Streptomyces griseiscabiei]
MTDNATTPDPVAPTAKEKVDTSVPASARIWNYWLGGKDNYAVDEAAGDAYAGAFPGIVTIARSSRAYLRRSIRHLVEVEGVRQFLDVGTGLPTADNTHQVAQRSAPEARIVYVDNDPMVLAHARALLYSAPEGATAYIDASLYDPERILEAAAATLDLSRPTALILSGILGHVAEYEEARDIVRRLLAGLPSGSYLNINEGSRGTDPDYERAQDAYNETGAVPYFLRPIDQITGYFDGLDLVDPGIVSVPLWRPEATDADAGAPKPIGQHGGLGRKP